MRRPPVISQRIFPIKEQVDGTYLSDWIYWNEQNRGKFYLVEKQARKGYFGAWKDRLSELITGHPAGWTDDDAQGKTVYYFEITGSRTEEGEQEEYCNPEDADGVGRGAWNESSMNARKEK